MRRVRSLRSEEKRKNNRRWRRRMRQVHLVSTLCVAAITASIPTNTDLQSHIPISAPRYTCNHDYLHSSQLCICAPHPPSSMNPGGSGGLSLSSNAGNHHNVQHVIPPAQSRPVEGTAPTSPRPSLHLATPRDAVRPHLRDDPSPAQPKVKVQHPVRPPPRIAPLLLLHQVRAWYSYIHTKRVLIICPSFRLVFRRRSGCTMTCR
ncbi:hypothetical protein CMEL01_06402 [Colletotrichum melonis]|uniref:Uncharacterized protein n=1 Tax=Colletotrichum melonis TaxID=1209925 RepID=A0AAI9U519_9PEZI|nr:hypothetical protein CMEL01_06402 [Colletotrichum melonis]